jgi:phage/plasmid-associated DNA primase
MSSWKLRSGPRKRCSKLTPKQSTLWTGRSAKHSKIREQVPVSRRAGEDDSPREKKVRQAIVSDFDQDPWTLNMENGTVDLRTGTLRPHTPEDLLSKMIPLRYDQQAKCPQFMAFLFRIMGSHPDASEADNLNADQMACYLQKAFGYAATGKPEKLLFVLYGEGNNGKTTLLEVIRDALGDKEYAG